MSYLSNVNRHWRGAAFTMKLTALTGFVLTGFLLAASAPAHADFLYTSAAQTGGALSSFGTPSIDAAGNLAFLATRTDRTVGVYTSRNGVVSTVAEPDGTIISVNTPTIGNGQVAFNASTTTGRTIFTGTTGSLTRLSTPGVPSLAVDINESGTVAYSVGSGGTLYKSTGGTRTVISSSGSGFDSIGAFSLANNGSVAFQAAINGGGTGLYYGNGGSLTTVTKTTAGGFDSLGSHSINALNQVAYVATTGADSGLYQRSGTSTATLLDTSGEFSAFGAVALNDAQRVAFSATYDAGGTGLYVSNSTGGFDLVARTGQVLMGARIDSLSFDSSGFNANGQVAFSAALNDGSQRVFTAMPTPEPATWAMMLLGIGVLAMVRTRKKA